MGFEKEKDRTLKAFALGNTDLSVTNFAATSSTSLITVTLVM